MDRRESTLKDGSFPELEKIAFNMYNYPNQYGGDIRLPGIDKMPKLRNIAVTKYEKF